MRVTMDTNRRDATRRTGTFDVHDVLVVVYARRRVRSPLVACACKFFCVNKPRLTSLRSTNDDEEVVIPLAHTHSLPRGSPVGVVRSSPAILITTSFSHWIRWRVKIEGATLLVSFSDSSTKAYSLCERWREMNIFCHVTSSELHDRRSMTNYVPLIIYVRRIGRTIGQSRIIPVCHIRWTK